MVEVARFVRSQPDEIDLLEQPRVDHLAEQLRQHLHEKSVEVALAHVHRASSSVIQSLVSELLEDQLCFKQEIAFTVRNELQVRPRPDFIFRLSPDRAIIAEVERGGTITNNHDLKDLWKAHISPETRHLFLIVPMSNWKKDGTAREKPFPAVVRRIGVFFGEPRREVDLTSVHIFGY